MISRSSVIRMYTAWYDFKILYHKNVYCLERFQDPLSWECILPGMISRPSVIRYILPGIISKSLVIRMYMNWYDFKILCHKNLYCLVWFQDPLLYNFKNIYIYIYIYIYICIYMRITQVIILLGVNRFRSMPEQGWVVRGQPIPE
jgi:hypothetical protein